VTLIVSCLVSGTVGTLVLTTLVRAASELGFTRMDLAFLLGTTVSDDRRKAKAIGYVFHFILGVAFALAYGLAFKVLGRSSWWIGGVIGVLHSLFISTVLVSVLLPIVHPRMGTPDTAANEVALIEPPGFLMLNYGRSTFVLNVVAHVVYGAIVGAMVRL